MKTLINAGINTDSFITGFSGGGNRIVRHLRLSSEDSFVKIYAVGNVLGKGTYGTVFEARDMRDNKIWATKVIEKNSTTKQHMNTIKREITILKALNHPHIIELREVLESDNKIYLILEKCSTDLQKLFQEKNSAFNEKTIRIIINDLTSAIYYLHKHFIVHRDVKLDNILVTDNPKNKSDHLYIKLSDFGLSVIRRDNGIASMMTDRCGTLQYMSPEVLSSKTYSQQCDIWAIGVIAYYMLQSNMPFSGKTEKELIDKVCNTEPSIPATFSPELADFFQRVLKKDPAARITAAELLNHAWLKEEKLVSHRPSHNVIDLMRLCKNDMRINVDDGTDDVLLATDEHGRSVAPVSVKNLTFDKNSKRTVNNKNSKGE